MQYTSTAMPLMLKYITITFLFSSFHSHMIHLSLLKGSRHHKKIVFSCFLYLYSVGWSFLKLCSKFQVDWTFLYFIVLKTSLEEFNLYVLPLLNHVNCTLIGSNVTAHADCTYFFNELRGSVISLSLDFSVIPGVMGCKRELNSVP